MASRSRLSALTGIFELVFAAVASGLVDDVVDALTNAALLPDDVGREVPFLPMSECEDEVASAAVGGPLRVSDAEPS